MSRTRVKICGITNLKDALAAVRSGADALGFVFYEPSPRNIDIDSVAKIVRVLPPFITVVGLFVDPNPDFVRKVLERVPLSLIQFHGDEEPLFCGQFGLPYMKAIRMRPGINLHVSCQQFHDCAGLLLDAYVKGVPGGTGKTFDWDSIPKDLSKPVVLAGGLTPDNVAIAVQTVQPWAVDVSGGVEAEKGIKSASLIEAFLQGVRSV